MLFCMLYSCVCRQQKRVGEQEEHGVKSKLPFNNHKYLHLVNSLPETRGIYRALQLLALFASVSCNSVTMARYVCMYVCMSVCV